MLDFHRSWDDGYFDPVINTESLRPAESHKMDLSFLSHVKPMICYRHVEMSSAMDGYLPLDIVRGPDEEIEAYRLTINLNTFRADALYDLKLSCRTLEDAYYPLENIDLSAITDGFANQHNPISVPVYIKRVFFLTRTGYEIPMPDTFEQQQSPFLLFLPEIIYLMIDLSGSLKDIYECIFRIEYKALGLDLVSRNLILDHEHLDLGYYYITKGRIQLEGGYSNALSRSIEVITPSLFSYAFPPKVRISDLTLRMVNWHLDPINSTKACAVDLGIGSTFITLRRKSLAKDQLTGDRLVTFEAFETGEENVNLVCHRLSSYYLWEDLIYLRFNQEPQS